MGNQPHEIKCKKCGVVKTVVTEFERRPDSKFGYRRTCKECRRPNKKRSYREWYCRNAEAERERSREYGNLHKKQRSDRAFIWRLKNPESVKENNRRYYLQNIDSILARNAEWRRLYRYRSFDYQLEDGGKDHRLELNVQQHWDETAAEHIQGLYDLLTPVEQEYCEAFMAGDIESIPGNVLDSIRAKFQEDAA